MAIGNGNRIIPVHKLPEGAGPALAIHYTSYELKKKDLSKLGIHRDDHYIFLLQEKGHSHMMLDFREISTEGQALFYILPGQVHQVLNWDHGTGWFLAIDTMLVGESYRAVFEEYILQQEPLPLNDQQAAPITACLQLLHEQFNQTPRTSFHTNIIHSLSSSLIGMIAAAFMDREQNTEQQNSRALAITRTFKKLLARNYKQMKSPSAYATAMHLSLTHLNDTVKAVSGFSVSHWIQQEIVLEAKRLLHYTTLNVKEIAHTLGYEDHTYFSRLFSKAASMAPGQFRRQSRE